MAECSDDEVQLTNQKCTKQQKIDKVLLIGTIGNTHEFVPNSEETWPIYIEHLEFYFKANNIRKDDKKKAILLTAMGSPTRILLRKLCLPKTTDNLTYKQINKILNDFYNPTSSKYVKRQEFNNRKQLPGESFASFVADLNGLSEHCEFENLETAIVNQIVIGMRDQGLKKRFVRQKKKLTLDEVKERGIASDQAYNEVLQMSGGNRVPNQQQAQQNAQYVFESPAPQSHRVNVNVTSTNTPLQLVQQCHGCGDWHARSECPHINKTCSYCKKKGHLIQVCGKLSAKRAREKEEEEEDDDFKENTECCVIL